MRPPPKNRRTSPGHKPLWEANRASRVAFYDVLIIAATAHVEELVTRGFSRLALAAMTLVTCSSSSAAAAMTTSL